MSMLYSYIMGAINLVILLASLRIIIGCSADMTRLAHAPLINRGAGFLKKSQGINLLSHVGRHFLFDYSYYINSLYYINI